jgi:hypothetical protein
VKLIPGDRRTMITVPMFAWVDEKKEDSVKRIPIIGFLTVDTSTPRDELPWGKADKLDLVDYIQREIVQRWADALLKLLQ